jgi:hypothetical protein
MIVKMRLLALSMHIVFAGQRSGAGARSGASQDVVVTFLYVSG